MSRRKVSLDIGDKDNVVKLNDVRIKDLELIPEWELQTTKATETIKNNETDQVVGVSSSIVKNYTVTLRPEQYYNQESADKDQSKKKKSK